MKDLSSGLPVREVWGQRAHPSLKPDSCQLALLETMATQRAMFSSRPEAAAWGGPPSSPGLFPICKWAQLTSGSAKRGLLDDATPLRTHNLISELAVRIYVGRHVALKALSPSILLSPPTSNSPGLCLGSLLSLLFAPDRVGDRKDLPRLT